MVIVRRESDCGANSEILGTASSHTSWCCQSGLEEQESSEQRERRHPFRTDQVLQSLSLPEHCPAVDLCLIITLAQEEVSVIGVKQCSVLWVQQYVIKRYLTAMLLQQNYIRFSPRLMTCLISGS